MNKNKDSQIIILLGGLQEILEHLLFLQDYHYQFMKNTYTDNNKIIHSISSVIKYEKLFDK